MRIVVVLTRRQDATSEWKFLPPHLTAFLSSKFQSNGKVFALNFFFVFFFFMCTSIIVENYLIGKFLMEEQLQEKMFEKRMFDKKTCYKVKVFFFLNTLKKALSPPLLLWVNFVARTTFKEIAKKSANFKDVRKSFFEARFHLIEVDGK